MPDRPFKFLDFYTREDASIFAGRRKEIDILLSDILSTRLVVLYAKTGSGKSSLINAGVRPKLEELEYPAVLIRVERDPVMSARRAFREAGLVSDGALDNFARMARQIVERANSPIVVFFDQFEEFFVYQSPDRQNAFIAEIAELYNDRDSGVHTVLSMREEFFYQLDTFRDYIPRIFHKESNLRLRWLKEPEARLAIRDPAARYGVTIEDKVIEDIVTSLGQNGYVEPARLQIVCDTLWEKHTDARIAWQLYWTELGGSLRILERRLVDDFDTHLSTPQLPALERAIRELSSDEGTKKIRAVEELRGAGPEMEPLIGRLTELRLLRPSVRERVAYVEWTSDYLAEHAGELVDAVHKLWLQRLVKSAAQGGVLNGEELLAVAAADWPEGIPMDAAGRLLRLALEQGIDMERFHTLAGPAAEEVLARCALDAGVPIEAAENAVRLLGKVGTPEAMAVLRQALEREDLAFEVISVLRHLRTPEAKALLQSASADSRLAPTIGAAAPALVSPVPYAARGAAPPVDAAGIEILHRRLSGGSMVILVGGEISAPLLPGDQQAAEVLLRDIDVPPAGDLSGAAELYETFAGRERLLSRMHELYGAVPSPLPIHAYLAGLPPEVTLVSLAYDDLLEDAFRSRGRVLQVVTRTRPGVWRHAVGDQWRVVAADELRLAEGTPALFKVRGDVSADDLVVTEEDHVTLASERLPAELRFALSRGALVLGVRADTWHARLLINLLLAQADHRRRKNFVVAPEFSPFETQFWRRRYTDPMRAHWDLLIEGAAAT